MNVATGLWGNWVVHVACGAADIIDQHASATLRYIKYTRTQAPVVPGVSTAGYWRGREPTEAELQDLQRPCHSMLVRVLLGKRSPGTSLWLI